MNQTVGLVIVPHLLLLPLFRGKEGELAKMADQHVWFFSEQLSLPLVAR